MRFITEFELTEAELNNKEINIRDRRKYRLEQELGQIISKSFGWEVRGATTLNARVKEKYTIEIEAFPMDKWIEFRKRFLTALPDYDSTSRIRLENALHDLESFGKPAE